MGTRSLADPANRLWAAVLAGELSLSNLRLLAYVGDEAARHLAVTSPPSSRALGTSATSSSSKSGSG